MRALLRRIGARTGISVMLVVVIAVVVVVARLASPERGPQLPAPVVVAPSSDPTAGDDGAVLTSPSPFADDATVAAAAASFTVAWLRRTLPAEAWLNGLRPFATPAMIGKLTGVDPLDVPEVVAPGSPTIRTRSDLYADVRVPIGPDAILLGMTKSGDRWLVDTLDLDEP